MQKELSVVWLGLSVLLIVVVVSGCVTSGTPLGGGIPICQNEPGRCPDLLPVVVTDQIDLDEGLGCFFCRQTQLDQQVAIAVSVKNQGGKGYYVEPSGLPTLGTPNASDFITRVVFSSSGGDTTVDLPTPALQAGFSVDLEPVLIPAHCMTQDCHITITADADQTVTESDEGNNTVSCFIPFVP